MNDVSNDSSTPHMLLKLCQKWTLSMGHAVSPQVKTDITHIIIKNVQYDQGVKLGCSNGFWNVQHIVSGASWCPS
jgi:hypothetical protein